MLEELFFIFIFVLFSPPACSRISREQTQGVVSRSSLRHRFLVQRPRVSERLSRDTFFIEKVGRLKLLHVRENIFKAEFTHIQKKFVIRVMRQSGRLFLTPRLFDLFMCSTNTQHTLVQVQSLTGSLESIEFQAVFVNSSEIVRITPITPSV